jgi:hypothetical protein
MYTCTDNAFSKDGILMEGFRDSKLIRCGVVGLVLGTGPLLLSVVIAHIQGDPNPNPVGPGILAGFTFTPSLICLIVGLIRARSSKSNASQNTTC